VLQRCERRGSLDAGVDSASAVANDFGAFFASHRRITHVFFNGALAHTMFMRHVRPALAAGSMAFVRLPSTSPAHAALTLDQKRQQWASIARALGGGAD
jgi:double-stranded uracil-DNA glycosylase